MKFSSLDKLPHKILVNELLESRYAEFPEGGRPSSWDSRKAGIDIVRSQDGEILKLKSDGQQSSPYKGWSLMITGGDCESGYRWTLYGIPRSESPHGGIHCGIHCGIHGGIHGDKATPA